jgi:hypothetical protein
VNWSCQVTTAGKNSINAKLGKNKIKQISKNDSIDV